jgi:hypothetical protein
LKASPVIAILRLFIALGAEPNKYNNVNNIVFFGGQVGIPVYALLCQIPILFLSRNSEDSQERWLLCVGYDGIRSILGVGGGERELVERQERAA